MARIDAQSGWTGPLATGVFAAAAASTMPGETGGPDCATANLKAAGMSEIASTTVQMV